MIIFLLSLSLLLSFSKNTVYTQIAVRLISDYMYNPGV